MNPLESPRESLYISEIEKLLHADHESCLTIAWKWKIMYIPAA